MPNSDPSASALPVNPLANVVPVKPTPINGDLNNTASMRTVNAPHRDPAFANRSLAIQTDEDDPETRSQYRRFLLSEETQHSDWVSKLELATVTEMAYSDLQQTGERLKVLVLYGSLRSR